MQFPESWLREFCDPPLSTQALADLLTMSGMEVEDLRPAAPPFSGVVVGEVLAVARHPAADRLSVCEVDAGAGRRLTIVCGAPNVTAGMKAPCALVGALLPPAEEGGAPFAITQSTLRGVESQGMLCSARELKLSEDHGGLLELGAEAPVGADVRAVLNLDDTLFTLKLTPNLAHCLSVYGIAREVSALTERWPQRARRSSIQRGVAARVFTPRTMRPVKRPHRSGASIATGSLSRCAGATGAKAGVFSGAPVNAATSRAMP
jgi:phenylalanyl-tRNA synthetase beta chain